MYSAEVNYWTFRAARYLLQQGGLDLMYLSTTDYMMHTRAPGASQSLEHMHNLDRLLGDIVADNPGMEIYLTADHGMNAKREAVDLARVLRTRAIAAEAIPIIRDKHTAHHQNLGGACYIYLDRPADSARAAELLKGAAGVEDVYDRRTAARLFRLDAERIGDLFVLGAKDVVFGELDRTIEPTTVRSHGSRHESRVPLVVYGRKVDLSECEYNLDLTRMLVREWQ
jgi:phosphonoacetate hydrolase